MSKEIAKILVDIKSINFSFDKYFTLTSGLASPVYVDCRKIISFTKERNFIIDKAADYLTKNNGFSLHSYRLMPGFMVSYAMLSDRRPFLQPTVHFIPKPINTIADGGTPLGLE